MAITRSKEELHADLHAFNSQRKDIVWVPLLSGPSLRIGKMGPLDINTTRIGWTQYDKNEVPPGMSAKIAEWNKQHSEDLQSPDMHTQNAAKWGCSRAEAKAKASSSPIPVKAWYRTISIPQSELTPDSYFDAKGKFTGLKRRPIQDNRKPADSLCHYANAHLDDTKVVNGKTWHVVKVEDDTTIWYSQNIGGKPEVCCPKLPNEFSLPKEQDPYRRTR